MDSHFVVTVSHLLVFSPRLCPFLFDLVPAHFLYCESVSQFRLFRFQSEAIRKAAADAEANGKGAIFVGRCSDYVLRDMANRIDVFITADIANRIRRVQHYYEVTEEEAAKKISDMERARAEYYNFYTEKTWGEAKGYHLSLDSTHISLEQVADLIESYARMSGIMPKKKE